jgi:hypothetical protein
MNLGTEDFMVYKLSTTMLRITGFSDFAHRLIFLKPENTTFRKLDLFPSSGEGGDTYSSVFLRKS